MAETKEVLRFNPSPTGHLHVGNLRTALFAWLWAKHTGGEFHFRIEDTDRARFVETAEDQIKASLEWLGLTWTGPVVRQSERVADGVYAEYAKQLVENDWAYVDDSADGTAIRFKWPDTPKPMEITYFDAAKPWQTTIDPESAPTAFEDFVLVKADGFPTYNFAHVVDDHELGVTRVIRGDEFTPSLNKYVALYEAFGWEPPKYNHVPPILGPDKSKLSKRHGAQDVLEYRAAGYLPMALANFLVLIGWSPGGNRELFFSMDELAETFTLDGIQKSPGVFDVEKLNWMNSEHLKQMDAGAVLAEAKAAGFWKEQETDRDAAVIGLALERSKTLKDLAAYRDSYFYHRPQLGKQQLIGEENPESVGVWLEKVQRQLEALPEKDWKTDTLHDQLTDVLEELGLKPKQLYPVLREALTAEPKTPALWDIMAVLGKAESLARLEAAAALVA